MRRHTLLRHAYTLAEVVLAIGIIIIVMLLLPPSYNHVRIGSKANDCRINMRNFALAVVQFEEYRGHFPGYREDVDGTPAISPDDDRSWMFAVLPYMDNRALYERLRPLPNSEINFGREVSTCKSTPPEMRTSDRTSYVANCGLLDTAGTRNKPFDFAANGVFHNRSAYAASLGQNVTVTSRYIVEGDGLTSTFMLSENVDAGRCAGGPTAANSSSIAPLERWTGFTWNYADNEPGPAHVSAPSMPLGINVRIGESQRTGSVARGFTRPSSYHPGGVNMAFCDARVRFVNENIGYRVYQALMTPRGRDATYNFPTVDGAPQALPPAHAARQPVPDDDIK